MISFLLSVPPLEMPGFMFPNVIFSSQHVRNGNRGQKMFCEIFVVVDIF